MNIYQLISTICWILFFHILCLIPHMDMTTVLTGVCAFLVTKSYMKDN